MVTTDANRQSAPNVAIYGTVHRTARIDAWSNNGSRDGPRPQHNTGLYDATGRISNVLAVDHRRAGLFSACGYEPSYQQRQ
jgi:hypothetical protein